MKNEYGVDLDRNGYAPSLFPWKHGECLICGRYDRPLQRHEVFHGPYRETSKRLGCWVYICDYCHMRIHGVDARNEKTLKRIMQKKAMEHYGLTTEQFREVFGKDYR